MLLAQLAQIDSFYHYTSITGESVPFNTLLYWVNSVAILSIPIPNFARGQQEKFNRRRMNPEEVQNTKYGFRSQLALLAPKSCVYRAKEEKYFNGRRKSVKGVKTTEKWARQLTDFCIYRIIDGKIIAYWRFRWNSITGRRRNREFHCFLIFHTPRNLSSDQTAKHLHAVLH